MVQAPKDMGEDSAASTDSHSTPIITQPSSSKPQKKKSRRKQRKDIGPIIHSLFLMWLLMRNLHLPLPVIHLKVVLDLEEAKTSQAKEIAILKKRVKQLEKQRKSRNLGLKRLRKVGSAYRVESSNDVMTLIDETQERFDEEMLFDVQDDLQGEEDVAEKEVAKKEVSVVDPVTTIGEVVTTASATTIVD
ncbi:hypothetical protein Tco_0147966 [Tanacetum coccineum]